jgi:hypothetical protein
MKLISSIFFVSLACLLPSEGITQSISVTPTVHFSYDANGNRIMRWVEITKISKADSSDTLRVDSASKLQQGKLSSINKITASLFPNPTEGFITLKIEGMETAENVEYSFFTISGVEILNGNTTSLETKLNIGNFPAGTYIVNVKLGRKVERWKVVKQ